MLASMTTTTACFLITPVSSLLSTALVVMATASSTISICPLPCNTVIAIWVSSAVCQVHSGHSLPPVLLLKQHLTPYSLLIMVFKCNNSDATVHSIYAIAWFVAFKRSLCEATYMYVTLKRPMIIYGFFHEEEQDIVCVFDVCSWRVMLCYNG